MRPPVPCVAQFADQGALGVAEGFAKDAIPLLPHDAQEWRGIEARFIAIPPQIIRPVLRDLRHPVFSMDGQQLALDKRAQAGLECFQSPAYVETPIELILPLLNKTARRHDQATLHIATNHQFLDQETRHNCLASPRIISEQEAQGLAHEHLAIDCGDLMGQWLDEGTVDGQERIDKDTRDGSDTPQRQGGSALHRRQTPRGGSLRQAQWWPRVPDRATRDPGGQQHLYR